MNFYTNSIPPDTIIRLTVTDGAGILTVNAIKSPWLMGYDAPPESPNPVYSKVIGPLIWKGTKRLATGENVKDGVGAT